MSAAAIRTAEPEADRSIVVERMIDAPRALVFEAFTDLKHLSHWWGPDGFSITASAFDFRVGGHWRFVMHGPDGRDYQNHVVFDVIDPPAQLVLHHVGDDPVDPVIHEMRISLDEEGGKTRLVWRLVFPTAENRDYVAREYGAVEGGQQNVARLAVYAAAMRR